MNIIDLNCDMGESFGAYTIGMDEKLLDYISSANIACGYHAGDANVMERTVKYCSEHGISVGAHPGFPDLLGFGRRNMNVTPEEAKVYVQYQVGALKAFCSEWKLPLHHVKPHGALYNMAAKDYRLAEGICRGILAAAPEAILLGLSGSQMIEAAKNTGLAYACEVFADRAYQPDGTLVPRSQPGAVISDEALAIARTVKMIKSGTVTACDGTEIAIQADSVCVHGDNEKALLFLQKINEALKSEGIAVKAF